ncbi:MAG TPA: recombinase family protein [Accumulibacter sp.]|nr:recombinase family protein [Accumulibacter sp.]
MSTTGNFILYTRCSTEEQSKKGNSHEYQAEGVRRSGVVRVGRMQEVAALSDTVTGTRFDNRASGLDAAYKLCERQRGTVSYLFVYRWDRLGRDVADCFDCIKRFRAVGVEVNCHDEWIDFSDPSYPLILSVKFGMAQSESMRME